MATALELIKQKRRRDVLREAKLQPGSKDDGDIRAAESAEGLIGYDIVRCPTETVSASRVPDMPTTSNNAGMSDGSYQCSRKYQLDGGGKYAAAGGHQEKQGGEQGGEQAAGRRQSGAGGGAGGGSPETEEPARPSDVA